MWKFGRGHTPSQGQQLGAARQRKQGGPSRRLTRPAVARLANVVRAEQPLGLGDAANSRAPARVPARGLVITDQAHPSRSDVGSPDAGRHDHAEISLRHLSGGR
jgi:hypothetical protein